MSPGVMNLEKNLIEDIDKKHKALLNLLSTHPEKTNLIFDLSSWLLFMREEIVEKQKNNCLLPGYKIHCQKHEGAGFYSQILQRLGRI